MTSPRPPVRTAARPAPAGAEQDLNKGANGQRQDARSTWPQAVETCRPDTVLGLPGWRAGTRTVRRLIR
ncbi:hypothetical protein ACFH04_01330 [Streptomyces noboritoensis]|uniref:Uncharacterized protein n=1 Tax=Streptomyces noboritoensis TaxID=67337 RepID=A0ABV6T9B8_9ACTN